ncbi:hypothetical protein D3C74_434770 [compost metagenome]
MGDVTLHFLAQLGIELALQLIERYVHQLAVEQINHLFHFGKGNLRRNLNRTVLYLPGTGNNNRHGVVAVERKQLKMAQ